MEEREKLKSRLGFILLSAGCAIGIGNVWKFPYTAGQGGGGAFVLFYLLFLIILGLPIMTMEFAVGRASQKSPVKAYQALEKPGQKWHIHGIITLIGCYLLMMFYTKVMMTSLLIIMIILAVNSFFMDGAKEGLAFYLIPDFERMKQIGIAKTITGAMNQAFFTLSLGIGAMAILGSYIGKERSLLGESVNIAILDTFVAITSGLIIFPACFTFHVDQTSGPSLIFITLPNIFNHIPLGRLWGSLFFLFMFFAAFSTILAVFENIISCGMELTGCSRQKSCAVNLVLIIVLSLPCVLGYNVWNWKGFSIFGGSVLDLEDFLVSNLFLPLGSLVYLLFCTSRYGWGWKNYTTEANTGKGLKIKNWMRGYITYILPLIVLFIFGFGIYDKFFTN